MRLQKKKQKIKSGITQQVFGRIGDQDILQYQLINEQGMMVSIINYGAAITGITVPDKQGIMNDIVLGFDSLQGYLQPANPYMGCIVGRYANRISNAVFELNNKRYKLSANDKGHCLHGGSNGFDKKIWQAKTINNHTALQMSYFSADGEEGFPGNLLVDVVYELKDDNSVQIDYCASTDSATPVNISSHCYFDLSSGTDNNILGHELQINADEFTETDEQLIPTGKRVAVRNTPMDFSTFKAIEKDIKKLSGGFDHNWVIAKKGNLDHAATLLHKHSGRIMKVYTTQPGIQFYSGNFLNGDLQHTKHGRQYAKHMGLCLETQHFPDAPNRPEFGETILTPGKIYHHTCVYAFGILP